MDCVFFLDTERLIYHSEKLWLCRCLTKELNEILRYTMRISDPKYEIFYLRLLRQTEEMSLYFEKLSSVMRETSMDAEATIRKIQNMMLELRPDFNAILDIDIGQF